MEKKIRVLNASEIEVKIKQITEKGAVILLYKTARVDMDILDETFGIGNWQTDYKEIKGNLYCGIGIRTPDKDWVWKWDCGVESREDSEGNQKKGEASDAFKRAGFKLGIGRELYTAPFIFAKIPTTKDGNKWILTNRFSKFYVKSISYKDGEIKDLEIVDEKGTIIWSNKASSKKTAEKNETTQPKKDAEVSQELLFNSIVAQVEVMTKDSYENAIKKITADFKNIQSKEKRDLLTTIIKEKQNLLGVKKDGTL